MAARVKVRLFHELLSSVGQSDIELEADTIAALLQSLIQMNAKIQEEIHDAHGGLRGNITFYVNNKVLNPTDLSRKLNDGDLILIVPIAAGG